MSLTKQNLFMKVLFLTYQAKNNFISIVVLITWLALWFSINTKPSEIYEIFNSPIQFFNGIRIVGPLILTIISLFLFIYLVILKKKKIFSIILVLFGLNFIAQLMGLINTEGRSFNFDNIYLALFGLGTVSTLIIFDNNYNKKIVSIFIYSSLIILFIAYLFTFLSIDTEIILKSLMNTNLYIAFHPEEKIFYQSSPRITGLTRALGLISISLISILLTSKNKSINIFIYLIIIFFSIIIWIGQSRGSLLCYYFTSLILIFLLNNLDFKKKIFLFISITFFSAFISQISLNKFNKSTFVLNIKEERKSIFNCKNNCEYEISNGGTQTVPVPIAKDRILDSGKGIRVFNTEYGSSGRLDLWKKSFLRYEKNKIFGYGPQGDRVILYEFTNKWSNNSSNMIVYSFLSGGYVGFILMIICYLYIAYLLCVFVLKNRIFKKKYKITSKNLIYTLSILFIIFFSLRSLFENSYGVFSIDFLLMILSLYIVEKEQKKINFKLLKSYL